MPATPRGAKSKPAQAHTQENAVSPRTAHAVAVVSLPPVLAALIANQELIGKKGPAFRTATLAGVLGAKNASSLIPLCHQIPLDDCRIELKPGRPDARGAIDVAIHCYVSAHARTSLDMEALSGASVAALTLIDMGRGISREIIIKEIRLIESVGGPHPYRSATHSTEPTTPEPDWI